MPTTGQKIWAFMQQRCPRCCHGTIYERSNKMYPHCPECGLVFEREPGYFLGAMYVSYGMASAVLFVGLLVFHLLLPELDLGWVVLICAACFVPFVPMTTRLSRVIWIYFDRWAWP